MVFNCMCIYIFFLVGAEWGISSKQKKCIKGEFSVSALNISTFKAATTRHASNGGGLSQKCHLQSGHGETCLDSSACQLVQLDGRVQFLLGLYCWSSGRCCLPPKWRRLFGQLRPCQVHQRSGPNPISIDFFDRMN